MASKVADAGAVTIRLHKRERGSYFGHPGIASVTFCQGDPRAAYASLKSKVQETLAANPWVGGRLDKQKNLTFNLTVTDADVDDILSICKNASVHRRQPYPKLVAACAKDPNVTVQNGKKTQKSGGRITKCVVVEPEQSGGEFAIVFSMSHVAADGHDYYRIYNMFCGTDPVDAMDPVRVAEYEATEFRWTGKKDPSTSVFIFSTRANLRTCAPPHTHVRMYAHAHTHTTPRDSDDWTHFGETMRLLRPSPKSFSSSPKRGTRTPLTPVAREISRNLAK